MRPHCALVILSLALPACIGPTRSPAGAAASVDTKADARDRDAGDIGPNTDADADTIPTPTDACPDEPGLAPDGCPLRDSDGDGVLDPDDACPQTPECTNGFEDEDGCPDTLPEELAALFGVVEGLEFAPDRWDILPASFPVLDHVAQLLARYPELQLEIEGHVEAGREMTLRRRQPTRRRAEAVRDYLIHAGVEPTRLISTGYGESKPIQSNETAEGRAANRRVELRPLAPAWAVEIGCEDDP